MSKDGGERGKRAGMDQAQEAANAHWWQCMLECGKIIAKRKPYFITDDIVRLCRSRHPNARTHEKRAIGPLMRELCNLGCCVTTNSWIKSTQTQCHRRPMMLWQSLISSATYQNGVTTMTGYLVNTRTKRKFEIIKIDRDKNLLTLRGETGGVFDEPYDKPRLKELGYQYVQKDEQQDGHVT
jgi:hypothetical protein